jgi:hypothetical protein
LGSHAEIRDAGAERLFGDITATAGGSTAAKVASLMSNYLTANGSVQLYSAGYATTRYIHQVIIAHGGQGIREVFDYLSTHTLSTLDDALGAVATAHAGMAFNSVATLTPLFASGQADRHRGAGERHADCGAATAPALITSPG